MIELQNELNKGFEARMRVLFNELTFIKSDMQRIFNELATIEDLYSKAFNRVAQYLSTHTLCSYEELRQQAREEFEKFKEVFFADIDAYKPFLEENGRNIQEIVDEINMMIQEGYNNSELIKDALTLAKQSRNYIHNSERAIERSKKMIEKLII